MNKDYRLKKKIEIDSIFLKKHSVGNSCFSIFNASNNLEHFRFALSIGRKYGNAVSRNLIKRRLRAIIQINKDYAFCKALQFVRYRRSVRINAQSLFLLCARKSSIQ